MASPKVTAGVGSLSREFDIGIGEKAFLEKGDWVQGSMQDHKVGSQTAY